jgi:hypothetical protein
MESAPYKHEAFVPVIVDGVGIAGAARLHRRDEIVRANQAADVGREYPIHAAS